MARGSGRRIRVINVAAVCCVWLATAARGDGVFQTVAIQGQQAPGTATGVNYTTVAAPAVLNGTGQVAFYSTIVGPGVTSGVDNAGFWYGALGAVQLLARQGDPAPGGPAGSTYRTITQNAMPAINTSGQVVFAASLNGSGLDSTNRDALWFGTTGSLQLLARTGTSAPGTSAGVNFSAFTNSILNETGQTAFTGNLTGTGVTTANDVGLWLGGVGTLQLVAREGALAPGTSGGVTFNSLSNSIGIDPPTLNDVGKVAFHATLSGAGVNSNNDTGVWVGNAASMQLAVRAGDGAPGTGAGVNFQTIVSSPAINNAGAIAFKSGLVGPGVTLDNGAGIWSGQPGALQLVARMGEQAPDVPSGAGITSFEFGPVLSGNGKVAFQAVLSGAGVTSANNFGIWSGSPGAMECIAREGDPAPGTAPGVVFGTSNISPALNDNGQIAFHMSLTGAGVSSANSSGVWATSLSGELLLIVRKGDVIDVDDGPGVDLRTVNGAFFYPGSGGQDSRLSGFNDSGQLALHMTFTNGSSGIFLTTVPEPSLPMLALLGGLGVRIRPQRTRRSGKNAK